MKYAFDLDIFIYLLGYHFVLNKFLDISRRHIPVFLCAPTSVFDTTQFQSNWLLSNIDCRSIVGRRMTFFAVIFVKRRTFVELEF